ncbi:MAG: DNA ligase D [Pseudomonadota bacterium]
MADALKAYKSKRNFALTREPADGGKTGPQGPAFVVQKHWARRLHYDFRLELDGTLKSWAVPKGPSLDPRDKRMAVHVEDHPLAYAAFEGAIPQGQYGAGKVIVWDKGSWQAQGDARAGYQAGHLKFALFGHKLRGRWALVRMEGRDADRKTWLLVKEKDEYARAAQQCSLVDEMPDSVADFPAADGAPTAPLGASAPAGAARGAMPPGALKAAMPAALAPQLASLADAPPSTPHDWLFEVKFDGYRLLARVQAKQARLFTRNGHDWSERLAPLCQALATMVLPDGWYDGEIVVHDDAGLPNFGMLQEAFENARTASIVYFLFDLPFFNGYDLRSVPLQARRALLRDVLATRADQAVRFSEEFNAPAQQILEAACSLGLEGLIGKRRDAPYVSRRTRDWIKLKCGLRQEFVIGGYTDPQGARAAVGSLLLGVHDADGALQYAGHVGSGFTEAALHMLQARLAPLATARSPFAGTVPPQRHVHWTEPTLVAQVRFGAWTKTGVVRHAVFEGLRADKPARAVTRELPRVLPGALPSTAQGARAPPAGPKPTLPPQFKLTHGERVVDAHSGVTKLELVRYYALVAPLMLAHLKDRPLALVRAPDGVAGQQFFQRHAEVGKLAGIRRIDPAPAPAEESMLVIASAQGLLSAAQWNVLEFHTQNATLAHYDRPNRIVFDLDPGEGLAWKSMLEAADIVHGFLDALGLRCFLKTSGGKGLHVVAPIKPAHDWETVKAFARACVHHLATTIPARFVFKSGARNRVGKVFVDYLRNGAGATTVAAWSARARPGLGISVPLGWEELGALKGGDQWTVRAIERRLDRGNAPWAAYARSARSLDAALRRLPGA